MTDCDETVIVMNNFSTKKYKYYRNKCYEHCFNNLSLQKSIRLLYFVHSFISDYITIDDYYYLPSLRKRKRYNMKWNIMNFKKFVLKIVRVITSMT